MITAFVLAAATAATPLSAPPVATLPVESYRVVVHSTSNDTIVRTVQGEDVRMQIVAPGFAPSVFVRGTEHWGRTATQRGSLLRDQYPARPDGFQRTADLYTELVASLLARARAGQATLVPATIGSTRALRATVALPPNACAALGPRRATVWLVADTLMPLQIVERTAAGKTVQVTRYSYRMVNRTFPAGTFTPPATAGPGRYVASDGFRRVAPAVAAERLPYTPRVPTTLPDGYRLVVSGWAPRSAATGAEASIPPSAWLFTAEYRRGQERITVSQRAGATDWPDDPFGHECGAVTTTDVSVGSAPAKYASGPEVIPHLFWREGKVRFTVSGPLPREALVQVAASLRPVR